MSLNKVEIEVNWNSPVLYGIGVDTYRGPNLERIDAALEAIDASPENWNQEDWAIRGSEDSIPNLPEIVVEPVPHCGTAMCLAGHVVTQAGYYLLFEKGLANTNVAVDSSGQRYYIDKLAKDLLNITHDQAEALFEYRNTRDGLAWVRGQIANGSRHPSI